MSNEYSVENLYNLSNNTFLLEASDYDNDTMYKELKSEEAFIDFISDYEKLNTKHTAEKLRMMKRINANYGRCNRGIESYCDEQSLEEDNDEKGNNFFAKIFYKIVHLLKRIWDWITEHLKTLFDKISRIFTHNRFSGFKDKDLKKLEEAIKTTKVQGFDPASRKYGIQLNMFTTTGLETKVKNFKAACDILSESFNMIKHDTEISNKTAEKIGTNCAKYTSVLQFGGTPGESKIAGSFKERKHSIDKLSATINYDKNEEKYLKEMFKNNIIKMNPKEPPTIFILAGTSMVGNFEKIIKGSLASVNKLFGNLQPSIKTLNMSVIEFSKMIEANKFEKVDMNKKVETGNNKESKRDILQLMFSMFKMASKLSSECFMKPLQLYMAELECINKNLDICASAIKKGWEDAAKSAVHGGPTPWSHVVDTASNASDNDSKKR